MMMTLVVVVVVVVEEVVVVAKVCPREGLVGHYYAIKRETSTMVGKPASCVHKETPGRHSSFYAFVSRLKRLNIPHLSCFLRGPPPAYWHFASVSQANELLIIADVFSDLLACLETYSGLALWLMSSSSTANKWQIPHSHGHSILYYYETTLSTSDEDLHAENLMRQYCVLYYV
jgi:hypothetical protein